jgi:cyclic lactone autoinducer peptide
MKWSKTAMVKMASVVASLVLVTATVSSFSTCSFAIFHQPQIPARLKELKKN